MVVVVPVIVVVVVIVAIVVVVAATLRAIKKLQIFSFNNFYVYDTFMVRDVHKQQQQQQ